MDNTYKITTHSDEETIEVAQNIEAEKVLCSKLVYNEVLEKAKEHSYNLQLADFDTLIAKQEIRGARSEYFPKLFL